MSERVYLFERTHPFRIQDVASTAVRGIRNSAVLERLPIMYKFIFRWPRNEVAAPEVLPKVNKITFRKYREPKGI